MEKKPKKCITSKKAKKLQDRYVKVIEKALKKEFKKDICRDFSWSLEELEDYIAYVKSEAKEKGYKDLGLRFFMGKYEDDEEKGDVTMFIAPTGTKENMVLKSAVSDDDDDTIEDIDPYNSGHSRIPPRNY